MKRVLGCILVTVLFWSIAFKPCATMAQVVETNAGTRATSTATLFYLDQDPDQRLVDGARYICNNVQSDLQRIGMYVYNMPLPTVASAKNAFATRRVVLFSCHAENDSINLSGGYLTSESIAASANYSACKLAYLSCCSIASDDSGGDNFCETLIDRGVGAVIGCTETIYVMFAREFATNYFDYIANNRYTVGNAYTYTKAALYGENFGHAVETMRFFGNTGLLIP